VQRFLQQRIHRRGAEPLHGELSQRGLVARHLVEDRRLGAPVCQQVDEVEDERRDAFGGEHARKSSLERAALGGGRNLLVANRNRELELGDLRLEQITLVRVERFVFTLAPPVWKTRRDLTGKEPAEQCIARVRRRRRQNAEVVCRFDVEYLRDGRLARGARG